MQIRPYPSSTAQGRATFMRRLLLVATIAMALVGNTLSTASADDRTIKPNVDIAAVSGASSQPTDISIPAGLTPTRLKGKVVPTDPGPGTIDLVINDRVAETFQASSSSDFDIPVSAADVVENALPISLRYRLAQPEDRDNNWCQPVDTNLATLKNLSVAVNGTSSTPKTVGEFFSPAATQAIVTVDEKPSFDAKQAGLSAVGAISSRYKQGINTWLSVGNTPAINNDKDLARIIEIKDGKNPVTTDLTVNDGIPTLTITGTGNELNQAARALASDKLSLAGSDTVTGLGQDGQAQPHDKLTFDDLGTSRITLDGYGQTGAYVGVTQSDFGGPVSAIDLSLHGEHSAIPDRVTATMSVYWNDFLVTSKVLDKDTTAIDIDETIPGTLIQQSNGLRVQLNAVPTDGQCTGNTDLIPVELDIDGKQSSLTGTRGQEVAPGFQRYPQALGSDLPITLGTGTPENTSLTNASYLINSLQRISAQQLNISMVSMGDLTGKRSSGLLVGASAQESNSIKAPLRLSEFRTINSLNQDKVTATDANGIAFGVGVDKPYAVLEAFETGNSNYLMLGSWAPNDSQKADAQRLESDLAKTVAQQENGWNALSKNLFVAQPGDAKPTLLDSNSVVPQPEVTSGYQGFVWWAVALVVLFGLLLLLRWWRSRQRRAKISRYVEAQERADATTEEKDSAADGEQNAPSQATDTTGKKNDD